MSTRCLIGIKKGNDVEYIFCHSDGYVRGGVGETLLKHYNYANTKRLMKLGDLDALGNEPKSLKLLWDNKFFSEYFGTSDYREIADTYCAAYRDRGEDEEDIKAKIVKAEDYDFSCQSDADYIYLLDEETREWKYMNYDMTEFIKLTLDSE